MMYYNSNFSIKETVWAHLQIILDGPSLKKDIFKAVPVNY